MNVLSFYLRNIKHPMMRLKKRGYKKMDKRNDQNLILIAKDKKN